MKNHLYETKDYPVNTHGVMEALGNIVGSYIQKNNIEANALLPFIQQVYTSLINLNSCNIQTRNAPQAPVDIENSITPDFIVCLEDGKKLKMLRRHLRTAYGMSPEEYRKRWNLPSDYPMVAPNYTQKRSNLARINQLGKGKGRYTHAQLASYSSKQSGSNVMNLNQTSSTSGAGSSSSNEFDNQGQVFAS